MLKGKINFKVAGQNSETDVQKAIDSIKESWEKELLFAKSELSVDNIIAEIEVKSDTSKIYGYATAALDLTDTEENRETFNKMMNGLSGWAHESLGIIPTWCGSPYAHAEIWCEDISGTGAPIKSRLKRLLGLR
jgi:hypothetical protein